MITFVFKKSVDQSLLNAGLIIPVESQAKLLNCLGIVLPKGAKQHIKIKLEGTDYDAVIMSVDHSERYANRTVLQIRYSAKSPICCALNRIFTYSAGIIAEKKEKSEGEKKQITIEEEYVDICVDEMNALVFKCHCVKDDIANDIAGSILLQPVINRLLTDYISAKQFPFAGHLLGVYIRNDAPEFLYQTGLVDRQTYLITGSVGQGNWAMVPWICIFNRKITTTATKGVYIVYLLSKDGNSLYLTLNQGCTDIRKNHSKKETIAIMRRKAEELAENIDSRGFLSDENINLGTGLTELAEMYQKGTIFYKKYCKDSVPDERELRDDLSKMMDIYKEYAGEKPEQDSYRLPRGGEEKLETKEVLAKIKSYIASRGFRYGDGLVENFYLSLKSKPFVILAGTSGTGKTRLVQLFAEAIGAAYKMVPVRPDWSDSSDLFGHINLNGEFVPGAITEFVFEACENKDKPYILCLDEMNLARVEYYMSDILSVIESRDFDTEGRIVTVPLMSSAQCGSRESDQKYAGLQFPENLYLVGTVNMDETTFPFSKKVLDRANTIEFSYVDLASPFNREPVSMAGGPVKVDNAFLKTEYLILQKDCIGEEESVGQYCLELQKINKILQSANAHVGYRVRDEIVFYLLNNKKAGGLLTDYEAMDNEILQKILPRIQGSSMAVKEMLFALFKVCVGNHAGIQPEQSDLAKNIMSLVSDSNCLYRKSAEKIAFMIRRYEEDGFTSYWL